MDSLEKVGALVHCNKKSFAFWELTPYLSAVSSSKTKGSYKENPGKTF